MPPGRRGGNHRAAGDPGAGRAAALDEDRPVGINHLLAWLLIDKHPCLGTAFAVNRDGRHDELAARGEVGRHAVLTFGSGQSV